MSVATKAKRIKLVFGIVIPVLVLVTTIVMVSMSFAWFSQETTASIQSINLATQKAFVLEFGNSGGANDNLEYMGQEALDETGFLRDLSNPATTEKDAAYYFVSPIKISTQNETKTLRLQLDSIKIENNGTWFDIYVDVEPDNNLNLENAYPGAETVKEITHFHLNSEANLAFTWFFKAGVEDAPEKNYTVTGQPGKREMKSLWPTGTETWYTPYGTMKFESGNLQTVNGETLKALPSAPQDITGFKASENTLEDGSVVDGTVFDFYIVFAPERVFWSQFFDLSNRVNVNAYLPQQQEEILGSVYFNGGVSPTYRMYYSNESYQSSKFYFNATLTVVDSVETGTP